MDALGLGDSLDGHERDDAASATHGDSPARGSTDLMGVKRQIQQYCVAKERDDAILSEARAEIKVLRDRIVELQVCRDCQPDQIIPCLSSHPRYHPTLNGGHLVHFPLAVIIHVDVLVGDELGLAT